MANPIPAKRATYAAIGIGLALFVYFVLGLIVLPLVFPNGSFFGRVLGSWVNLFSLLAFGLAMALLIAREAEIRWNHASVGRVDLPGGSGRLATTADARRLRQQINELSESERSPLPMLLLETALSRAKANWKTDEVASAVMQQAEVRRIAADTGYGVIRYLAWAIPSIGFVGTVLGVGEAMVAAGGGGGSEASPLQAASRSLGVAFDTTFVALVLSLILTYVLYRAEAHEDQLSVDSVSWVTNGFVNQMYDLDEKA